MPLSRLLREIFEQIESDVMMINRNLWIPCVRKFTKDKFLQELYDSFSFSLDIPLKTAVASCQFALHPNKYLKGVELDPEPGDIILKAPLIVGLLNATPNEFLGDPFIGFLFT